MMLLAVLAIWLTLVLFFVVLCRGAAYADGRDLDSAERSPGSAAHARTLAAGLVAWEEQPEVMLRDLRARARGARGRVTRGSSAIFKSPSFASLRWRGRDRRA